MWWAKNRHTVVYISSGCETCFEAISFPFVSVGQVVHALLLRTCVLACAAPALRLRVLIYVLALQYLHVCMCALLLLLGGAQASGRLHRRARRFP
jgi:hypothetical protein